MSDYVRPQWRVAFDLGSAFSTFAYCRTNRIHIGGPWKSFQGHHYSKMPTALLYNEAGHVEKYGFDWLKVTNAADAQRYFDYFKKKADEEAKRMRFVLYIYYIQCIQTITNSDSFVRNNLSNSTLEHCYLTGPPRCSN